MNYQLPPPPSGPTKGHVCEASSLTEVWVAAMVVQADVAVKDRAATTPLKGGAAALFAPTTYKSVTNARICGVATTEAEVRECLDDWVRANPGVQGEEVVARVPFGKQALFAEPANTPKLECLDCHTSIGIGFYCNPCQKKRWEVRRNADPELANV